MRGALRGLLAVVFLTSAYSARAQGPSFDCNKAKLAVEFAVCGSEELSELDRILAAGYAFIKATKGLAAADRIGKPYYFQRVACGSDVACIGASQVNEIRDLAAAGAPVSLSGVAE